jgi:hypothetical protein
MLKGHGSHLCLVISYLYRDACSFPQYPQAISSVVLWNRARMPHSKSFIQFMTTINTHLAVLDVCRGLLETDYIVTCRPISRQRPKYTDTTIEPTSQQVFSMWFLYNGPINTHYRQQKTVFSVGSVPRSLSWRQSTLQAVESWGFSRGVLTSGQRNLKNLHS